MAGGIPGGYDLPGGAPPAPANKSGGTACMTWGLVGCGVLGLVVIISVSVAVWKFSRNKELTKAFSGAVATASCRPGMLAMRDAIDRYRTDHQGNYPPSLKALVPGYLDQTNLVCGEGASETFPAEYTPPDPDAPGDTIIVNVQTGSVSLVPKERQILYMRLLKDGRIVFDQVARQELIPANRQESGSQ